MGTDSDHDFTRRKFTLTEQLDSDLERMAANHYQGNVSLCLRQAITDHRETLNGNGRLTLKQLVQTLQQVQDDVTDIERKIETQANQAQQQATCQSKPASAAVQKQQIGPNARHILSILAEAGSPLRVADINERADLKPVVVRQSLDYLIDQGYVFSTDNDPPRYHRARMTDPNGSNETQTRR